MKFHVLPARSHVPETGNNEVYLQIDNWNDYSFVTSFHVYVFDGSGVGHNLSDVRIGFVGQTESVATYEKLDKTFERLPDGFFSLSSDVDYYKKLHSDFDSRWKTEYLERLYDVAWNHQILDAVEGEKVFRTSHLRSVNINKVRDQFTSVVRGDVLLTDFHFGFHLPASDEVAEFDLDFSVTANSTPSTNMHALIGRNGVGKTTLLNSMVKAVAVEGDTQAYFYTIDIFQEKEPQNNYFDGLVSVAFSVFDPFDLPKENNETAYSYIGMTDYSGDDGAIIKSKERVFDEFAQGLAYCFAEDRRRNRWVQAVQTLQSDDNFAEMNLLSLESLRAEELDYHARTLIASMSSGHSVVIVTMTLLVAKLEEKSLVLFDEPESHLHPPLLSALIRSLSQLLHARNAVAIIATHSPVVLQEIPKSCVWKVFRTNFASEKKRPDTETFGENVGTLTREVFGLEVERSGFHTVLRDLVFKGGSYEEILSELGGKLGDEARGILKAMVVNRDEKSN